MERPFWWAGRVRERQQVLGGPTRWMGGTGKPSWRVRKGRRPSWRAGRGREAIREGRKGSKVPFGGPGGVGKGLEAFPEGQKSQAGLGGPL